MGHLIGIEKKATSSSLGSNPMLLIPKNTQKQNRQRGRKKDIPYSTRNKGLQLFLLDCD